MTRLRCYIFQTVRSHGPNSNDKQLSSGSHFSNDLGLDSLDTVEVVMAIEEVGFCGLCRCKSGMLISATGIQHRNP